MEGRISAWIRVPEAAEYFRVPRGRMHFSIRPGELPAVGIEERGVGVERFRSDHRRVLPVTL